MLFLLGSARKNGNAEQLARLAAQGLPPQTTQTWLHLHDFPPPPFEDLRHTVGVYPQPQGHEQALLEATLAATDLVFVSPVYWYSVSSDLKRYLDEWSAWLRVPDLDFREQMRGKRFWIVASSTGPRAQAEPMFATLEYCATYFGGHIEKILLGNGSKPADALSNLATVQAAREFFGA